MTRMTQTVTSILTKYVVPVILGAGITWAQVFGLSRLNPTPRFSQESTATVYILEEAVELAELTDENSAQQYVYDETGEEFSDEGDWELDYEADDEYSSEGSDPLSDLSDEEVMVMETPNQRIQYVLSIFLNTDILSDLESRSLRNEVKNLNTEVDNLKKELIIAKGVEKSYEDYIGNLADKYGEEKKSSDSSITNLETEQIRENNAWEIFDIKRKLQEEKASLYMKLRQQQKRNKLRKLWVQNLEEEYWKVKTPWTSGSPTHRGRDGSADLLRQQVEESKEILRKTKVKYRKRFIVFCLLQLPIYLYLWKR